jgi:SAM-dependent methyltransferase
VSTELYGPEFFVGRSETVTRSAAYVVRVIDDLFQPTSVLDLGCGQGEWLAAFGLDDMQGIDIAAPVPWLQLDLTVPLYLHRTFDLVLCLETAEHLPPDAAETIVNSCVRHTNTVVFSAAVPGQEGKGHINCQPHEYWHACFDIRGYEMLDCVRPYIKHPDVSPWYRDNIFAYVAR